VLFRSKEEFEAAVADLKTAFVEALSPVIESVSVLAEAAKPVEVVDGEETPEEVVEAIDPIELAAKFNESALPKIALTRVVESLKAETNTKTVEELIEAEKAYAAQLIESAIVEAPAQDTFGVIEESIKSTPADELAAIVGRISGK
jgi:hypothetical protein